MSSFKHPVGSQSSGVYWRRRAVVIGALLLILVVILLVATKPGAGSGAVPAPTKSSPATAVAGSGSAGAGAGAGAGGAVAPSGAAAGAGAGASATAAPTATGAATTPATSAAGDGTCAATDITLKPIADKVTYTSLQQPQISMSITNSSASACSIDLGSSQQTLRITSGTETYWTSKDCQVNGTHQIVKLTAGQTLTTPAIAWDRTRSSTTTCNTTRSSVPAHGASYHLSVSVGTITSATSALMVLN